MSIAKPIISGLVLALATTSALAAGDPVGAAYKMCSTFDQSGLTTACDVSGWNSTVDVRVDMSSAEARKLCTQIAERMAGEFEGSWKLRIFSPYSGDQPIAVCALR